MKTKLYTFLTGLLMAACITNYGQEIVSTFEHTIDQVFSYNDLQICSDGSVLSGIYCYSPASGQSTGFHVCKVSSEGQLIDSVTFPPAWELLGIPRTPDVFVLPNYLFDEENGDLSIKMTLIDADLNVTDDITTLLATDLDIFMEDVMFVSPSGDLIVTYWTEDVFHIARIGLDGTLKAISETSQILPQNIYGHPTVDSSLYYQKAGVFYESPERFYKLGGYIPEHENDPWPLIAYIFDADLHLTDTVVYGYVDENNTCEMAGMMDHIVPITKSSIKETYLLAGQIRTSDDKYATSLTKYDKENNVIQYVNLEMPTINGGYPINTEVIDENTIYHTFETYPFGYYNAPLTRIARLDRDLNVVWDVKLPQIANAMHYGLTLKVLSNGNVAVSVVSGSLSGCKLYIYIIRENDPTSTPEMTVTEKTYTLYPNPVKDHLTLRFDDGSEPESVELYDLAGRLVGTKSNGLECIDMSAMPSGMYMLRVTMKDGARYHEKILKE